MAKNEKIKNQDFKEFGEFDGFEVELVEDDFDPFEDVTKLVDDIQAFLEEMLADIPEEDESGGGMIMGIS